MESPAPQKLQDRMIEAAAFCVGVLAIIVLLSWQFDFWKLAALGSNYVPMASSTAWLLLLLGCALFLCRNWPLRRATALFTLLALSCASLISILVLCRSLLVFPQPLEQLLAPSPVRVGEVPVGSMSLLTAGVFLLISQALLFQLPLFGQRRLLRQIASLYALLTLLIGLIVILSYWTGMPLLYGSKTIPMALPTAIAFSLLGCGVLLNSGNDTWPLSFFTIRTSSSSPSLFHRFTSGPLVVFLILSLAIATAGSLLLKKQISHSRKQTQKELSAVAELKSSQIARWYAERQDDAQELFHNNLMQLQLRNFLNGSKGAPNRDEIQEWLTNLRKKDYRRIVLFDASGRPQLWAPSNMPPPRQDFRFELQGALSADTVLTTDLHREASDRSGERPEINLNIWIPLGTGPGSGSSARGALLMQIDPELVIYPLIQTWPSPSSTAETFIVKREGGDVVYLNELRHQTGTALSRRVSIDTKRLPAAMAVKGQTGVVEGEDYEKVPVLAVLRAIQGTPWRMVAKVNLEEVYAPLRQQAWKTGSIMLTLILAAALGVSLLWQQYENQLLRRELALEQERTRMDEDLREANNELEIRVLERTAQLQAANQELEAFAYSVSHDLRAPLRAMGGFSEALIEDFGDKLEGEARAYLDEIMIGSRHMGQLIDGLLTLSRSTRGELHRDRVDLSAVADSIRRELEQSEPGRQVVWRIEPGLCVGGDARMIEVVMRNLLGNAWKYTTGTAEPKISLYSELDGKERFFCVTDNGAGFDMAHAEKLFQPFQRLHRQDEFPGIGIGLATVHRIVHRHGGTIKATGEPHKGTTFRFSLPYGEAQ